MQLTPEQKKAIESQKENCPFCKIIKGEIESKKVYEDDKIIALLDINPASKGHTLVMPKEHYPITPLIPEQDFSYLAKITKKLSGAIKKALICDTNIFIANGAAAGQQSQHFMLHVIPREKHDGIEIFDLKEEGQEKKKLEEAYKILSNNLPIMINNHLKRFPTKDNQGKLVKPLMEVKDKVFTKEQVKNIIENNPQLKEAIIKSPGEFKKMIPTNAQLKQIFANIDVDELIREFVPTWKPGKEVEAEIVEEKKEKKEQKEEKKEKKKEEKEEKADLDEIAGLFK